MSKVFVGEEGRLGRGGRRACVGVAFAAVNGVGPGGVWRGCCERCHVAEEGIYSFWREGSGLWCRQGGRQRCGGSLSVALGLEVV